MIFFKYSGRHNNRRKKKRKTMKIKKQMNYIKK